MEESAEDKSAVPAEVPPKTMEERLSAVEKEVVNLTAVYADVAKELIFLRTTLVYLHQVQMMAAMQMQGGLAAEGMQMGAAAQQTQQQAVPPPPAEEPEEEEGDEPKKSKKKRKAKEATEEEGVSRRSSRSQNNDDADEEDKGEGRSRRRRTEDS
eukprot:m.335495 g.335495  ORF g.335495 m.335495 type:complete len:155 (-) comp17610_c0_seq1:127-591(-)